MITSIILSITLVFEQKGVATIPASQASFVASLTIVIVPVLLLFFRKKPSKNNILGIVLILCGLAFTSGIRLGEPLDIGVSYMLAACLTTSIYTIAIDRFTKDSDPLLLGIGQMFFSAIFGIFLLAFFAKAYAYIMLMYSQKYANPINVTVIAATEPIITLLLASLIPSTFGSTEHFSMLKLAGAFLIAIGAICAGTNFLERKGGDQVERAHLSLPS